MATSAERLKQYEDLFNQSQAYDPSKYQADFERAYGEATNYNQDLIRQQSEALGNLQSVAPELRQRYSQSLIKDPTLQRSLIAQARQAPIADYSTAVNLLGQRGQRYSDILGKSTAGYQTAAEQAQTAAESAWRMYQDQVAQEEAARARAAAAANRGPSIEEILELLRGNGEEVEEEEGGEDIDTEPNIWERAKKVMDNDSIWGGYDWSKSPNAGAVAPTFGNILKSGISLPSTLLKTGSGFLGNLIGNWGQKDKSFLEKLYDERF